MVLVIGIDIDTIKRLTIYNTISHRSSARTIFIVCKIAHVIILFAINQSSRVNAFNFPCVIISKSLEKIIIVMATNCAICKLASFCTFGIIGKITRKIIV